MNQVPVVVTDVLQTPKSQAHSPVTVRIMRGIAAALPLHPDESTPWEIWNAVAIARIHAVNASLQHQALYVGRSCLLLNGIQGWSANPQITIYRPTRRSTSRLPACSVGSTTVPASLHSLRNADALTDWKRNTRTMHSSVAFSKRSRWRLSSSDAWHCISGATFQCLSRWNHVNGQRKSA